MQVKYKAMIFHLQEMTIRRRILKIHENTAGNGIYIHNQNS